MQALDDDTVMQAIVKDEKMGHKSQNTTAKPYKDSLNFKVIKETQLVSNSLSGPSYAKSYH